MLRTLKDREYPARVWMALIAAALACSQAPSTAAPSATPALPSATDSAGPSATNAAVSTSATVTAEPTTGPTLMPRSASPILIGTEYVLTDNPSRIGALAELLAPIGLPMAKPLPAPFSWGKMQTSPDAAIDFSRLDVFVREFQEAGFSDFLIALILTQQNVTAPVFLNSMQSVSAGQLFGPQAALAVILILPPALFGLSIQRYLVRGLTFGAIKR